MELVVKKNEHSKNKEKKIRKASSLSSTITSSNNTPHTEHPFTTSNLLTIMEWKDYSTLEFYLSNPHINPNTNHAPHIFARTRAYPAIEMLLLDPRTDFSQRDLSQKFVSDYIDREDENLSELRRKLFARFTLDMVTNNVCEKIKQTYKTDFIYKKDFLTTIQLIRDKISNDKTHQELQNDRELPPSACFPTYADDDFMTKKIWFILSTPEKL